MAEHTAFFLFFLLLFIIGAIWAVRILGMYFEPAAHDLGQALEAA